MQEKKLTIKKKICFILLCLTIGIFVLEVITRVLILVNHTLEPMIPLSIGQFDERLGWSLKPYASGTSHRTGHKITYQINSKGLRDEELSYEKPQNIFRIVFMGDSNVFGYGVPIEKHFSTLLEGYFQNVEVVNMGVSGFGVDQELLYLRAEGFRYHPDLVIAYVPHYADERHMYTNRFGKAKPRFILGKGQLVLTNSPVKNSSIIPDPLQPIHYWCIRYSKLCELIHVNTYAFIQTLSNLTRHNSPRKQQEVDHLADQRFQKELYELGERIVSEMDKECQEYGVPFILVTRIPELHETFLKQGKLSLNIEEALSNKKFKIPNDTHSNEPASGVIAWEIAHFLQTWTLIPRQYQQ